MKKIILLTITLLIIVFSLSKGFLSKSNIFERERITEIYLQRNYDQALSATEKYLSKYPEDDLAWKIKGAILEDKDLDAEAETTYNKALSLNEKNFQAINALGIIYRKKGNDEKAMKYYQKALELEPTYAQAYSSMAVIALKRYNDKKALESVKKGYGNDKEYPVIAANLAVAYHYNEMFGERDKFTETAKNL